MRTMPVIVLACVIASATSLMNPGDPSNACSSGQPYRAMMMPLACSITGMLASRACSRACAL
jgi:hypothetical protein